MSFLRSLKLFISVLKKVMQCVYLLSCDKTNGLLILPFLRHLHSLCISQFLLNKEPLHFFFEKVSNSYFIFHGVSSLFVLFVFVCSLFVPNVSLFEFISAMKLRQTTATSARSTYHVPRERAVLGSIALRKHDIVIISDCVKKNYRKIPKRSPGAYIFQRPFFGGAYLRTDICVTKSIGLAL